MGHKRSISREEETLWRQVTYGIEPLSPAPLGAQPAKHVPTGDDPTVRKAREPAKKDQAKPTRLSPLPTAIPAPILAPISVPILSAKKHPELTPGNSAGLDKRNAQRLKRGQLRPEARVDLHGMIQIEAHAALNDFIAESHMAGLRNVLVITGKGSVREGGVLRRMVPRWLNQPPLRSMVVAIQQATPRDGGGGAYYLLLRRRR